MGDGKEKVQTEGARMKTYHIYLKEECLFKDLNEEEFDVIWGRIYRSYFKDDLTYVSVKDQELVKEEHSC